MLSSVTLVCKASLSMFSGKLTDGRRYLAAVGMAAGQQMQSKRGKLNEKFFFIVFVEVELLGQLGSTDLRNLPGWLNCHLGADGRPARSRASLAPRGNLDPAGRQCAPR